VVDDHQDTMSTLAMLLSRRGYEVRSAGSVARAMEVADKFEFDVLITDVGLPDGSGVNLFEALKEDPRHHEVRGVAVSGFGMDEDIERSRKAGFEQHLTKPIDISLLQRTLVRIAREPVLAT
jgi:CheY-like chemotaxis protein